MSPQFKLTRLADRSDVALLDELRRVASLVADRFLSVKSFESRSKISASTLRRRFGSWERALEEAGLSDRLKKIVITDKVRMQVGRSMNEQDVIAELRRVASELGSEYLTQDAFNRYGRMEAGTVRSRFGSWNRALKLAGLSIAPLGRRYDDDQCFENLLTVWTHYGRPPQHREMTLPPSTVGPKAYVKRWGTWLKALQAFADRVDSDLASTTDRPPSMTDGRVSVEKIFPRRVDEADVRDIRIGLRYAVLKRDNFKCVLCGASPATDPCCKLHVDHIVAWSRGGRTIISNLRTLCEPCNLGKGAQLE